MIVWPASKKTADRHRGKGVRNTPAGHSTCVHCAPIIVSKLVHSRTGCVQGSRGEKYNCSFS